MDPKYVPPIAVLSLVLFVALVLVFIRLVKPRREIGEGDMSQPGQPPPDQLPVVTDEPIAAKPPGLYGSGLIPVPGEPFPLDPDLRPKDQRPVPPPPCRACREPLEVGAIPLEDWERVHSFWERLAGNGWLQPFFQALRVVRPREHGRELDQVLAGFCRSCSAIAQPLRRAHREAQAVRRLAEDRQYEREGLPEAVREAIGQERERYQADKAQRSRRNWGRE